MYQLTCSHWMQVSAPGLVQLHNFVPQPQLQTLCAYISHVIRTNVIAYCISLFALTNNLRSCLVWQKKKKQLKQTGSAEFMESFIKKA